MTVSGGSPRRLCMSARRRTSRVHYMHRRVCVTKPPPPPPPSIKSRFCQRSHSPFVRSFVGYWPSLDGSLHRVPKNQAIWCLVTSSANEIDRFFHQMIGIWICTVFFSDGSRDVAMATNFRAKFGYIGLFGRSAFWNGLQYRHSDSTMLNGNILSTSCASSMKIGQVTQRLRG